MSINQFINNNELAKSIVSQYLGAESLKNKFTNEVLKEYNEIVNICKKLKFYHLKGYFHNNTLYTKYYKIYNLKYVIQSDLVYCIYNMTYIKKYELFIIMVNGHKFKYAQYMSVLDNYNEPPNLILQRDYFD